MNSILAPVALAFLAALAWKATIVLALASGASCLLARHSAALRHGVWTLAVAALLALPLLQAGAPPLRTPLPLAQARAALPAASPAPRVSELRSLSDPALRPAAPSKSAARPLDVPLLLLLAWLAGAALVSGYFTIGRMTLSRLARRAREPEDLSWRDTANEVAKGLRLGRLPRFLVADEAIAPLTWGVLEPKVLLPASAAGWPLAQRRSFLVHELAHVARRDCAIQEAAHLACALYWFHPAVWLAAHRLRVEREHACDDLVLADGAAADAYAGQLLDVVRSGRVPRGALALSGAAMASPSHLESRVRALLDEQRDRRRIGRGHAVLAGAIGLALVLPLAAAAPGAATRAPKAKVEFARGLGERWERVLRDGAPGMRGKAFWFAYAIPFDGGRNGEETLLSDSEGWSPGDLEARGIKLSDRLGSGERDAVLLFHVPAGGAQDTPGFDRVAVRSGRLAPDLGGEPVVALGPVTLDESVDWLLARLGETPDDRRAAVLVTALALHDVPRVESLLEQILGGRRANVVRAQAAEGLARHPGAASLAALDTHARRDPSQEVRRESAEAMGDLEYAAATPALIALARELDDATVRAEAVESLGARDAAAVVPVLVAIANEDGDETVRREAVETLGDLPANAGLAALRSLAQRHKDPAVRSEALETLSELGARAQQATRRR